MGETRVLNGAGRIIAATLCLVAPLVAPVAARADDEGRGTVARPTLSGPVTGGHGSPALASTSFPLAPLGYTDTEFFLSGVATSYVNVGPLQTNGRWHVTRRVSAPYRTRILVRRPTDPDRFNGTVIVEWLNVSGGLDAAPDWINAHTTFLREGFAWVGVSAQQVGVSSGPGSLKAQDPARYASLIHPGDSFSYDIFSQAGRAVRDAFGPRALGDLHPRRVIATGESQSAFRLVTYVDAVQPIAGAFDGILIHSRGGTGAPLSQSPQPTIPVPGPTLIRDDVGVPVLTFETETDLVTLGYFPARQPDTRRFRLWEVAGTAHADLYTLSVGFGDAGHAAADTTYLAPNATPIPGIISCASPINQGPQHYVLDAAFVRLNEWVEDGTPPESQPRLQIVSSPSPTIVRDAHGNARGGIRTPQLDVPIATLTGGAQTGGAFCTLFGTTVPFSAGTLASLYPSHAGYVHRIDEAADRAVDQGVVLEADEHAINTAARSSAIGG